MSEYKDELKGRILTALADTCSLTGYFYDPIKTPIVVEAIADAVMRPTVPRVTATCEPLPQVSVEECIAAGCSSTLRGHDAEVDLKEQYSRLQEPA